MVKDDDKTARHRAEKSDVQYPLPFGGPKEHAAFLDILGQLEAGQLTPEQAQSRVMQLHHLGMGAWIRALGETRPGLVPQLVSRLLKDLSLIAGQFGALDPTQAVEVAPVSARDRVKGKSRDIMLRERIVMRALLASDQPMTFKELRFLLLATEPDLKPPTLTANLDRLTREGLIARPSKGYYAGIAATRAYLDALQDEIDVRGPERK